MSLTLYSHPLASFCHKVLIALYDSAIDFTAVTVDFRDPAQSEHLQSLWPVGKIPVLVDETRHVSLPETSIIIEYLQNLHPEVAKLIPEDPAHALDVRLWDRFFDLYVSQPMQKIVADRLRPEDHRDPYGVDEARATLDLSYGMIEERMASRDWACGQDFSLADCSAAPAVFYSGWVHSWGDKRPALTNYFERLMARPSIARTYEEAKPFMQFFPFHENVPQRFR